MFEYSIAKDLKLKGNLANTHQYIENMLKSFLADLKETWGYEEVAQELKEWMNEQGKAE